MLSILRRARRTTRTATRMTTRFLALLLPLMTVLSLPGSAVQAAEAASAAQPGTEALAAHVALADVSGIEVAAEPQHGSSWGPAHTVQARRDGGLVACHAQAR